MSTADRLIAAAARLGIAVDADRAARLAPLIDRVEAALAEAATSPAAPAAASPAPAPSQTPTEGGQGGSGWVWQVGADESPTPPAGGPLSGWRLAVKDLIAVAGHPLRCGSAATFDAAPEPADAPVVAQLRAAGAVLVGATRLHEFAFGTTGLNAASLTPANPAAPGRVPGGSSSGAAAVVAAGEADLSLGTDTGGSVRIPAALCGVVGFKPAFGALPTDGVHPLAPSLDHVGYLVADTDALVAPARVLGLLGADQPLVAARRLGIARGALDLCDGAVASAIGRAVDRLSQAGLEIVEVAWPAGEEVFAATTAIMFAEAAHGHRRLLAARHHLYGADVADRLLQGLAVSAETYLESRDCQHRLTARCRELLGGVDAVLTPTVPILAPTLAEGSNPAVGGRLVTFTRLADLTGLPALSLPVPVDLSGCDLPVGLQLEGADHASLLGAAQSVAAALAG